MRRLSTYAALVILAPVSLAAQQRAADLLLTNGRVYTVDQVRPQATAIAVSGGRITFVGSDTEARALTGSGTRVVDLGGRTVIPGFIDAHAHLLGLGTSLRRVNLVGAASYEEVVSRVVEWAKTVKPGDWIIGRGWDQTRWPGAAFPTHEALSRALPNNPVALTRVDGHALLANAKAMQLAGVAASTPDPTGGRIIRSASGAPTGVFVDNAEELIGKVIPPSSPEEKRRAILAAIAECNRHGLVGIHDAGQDTLTVRIYEDLAREGNFNLRNYVMLSDP